MLPRILVLHANGTNRDLDAARAFELAGAAPEIVHINQLRGKEKCWGDYQILVIPGGFSYADTLGAGRLLALDLRVYFVDEMREFIAAGRPVIGICNGFQALVKAGLLPANTQRATGKDQPEATLTFNARGRFECRWVTLLPQSHKCLWTRGLGPIDCPVAHGEGNLTFRDAAMVDSLQADDQIALTYSGSTYPANPNGSTADIAGICNPQGNVLGLMPHPEDHVVGCQHPRWTRGENRGLGLRLFENGVRHVKGLL